LALAGAILGVTGCNGSDGGGPVSSPPRPEHVPLAIVIIHGVGNEKVGYSKPLQELLKPKLPTAHFEEVLWSDLGTVLGLRTQESPEQRAAREAWERQIDLAGAAARASRTDPAEAAKVDQETAAARGYVGPIVQYEYLPTGERERIQARLRDALEWAAGHADRTIVIGHSLGSVIAFDVLDGLSKAGAGGRVELLCTLGSPLGNSIFLGHGGRSKSRPSDTGAWLNVYSPHDLIASALQSSYQGVTDLKIETSILPLTAHSAYWTHADVVNAIVTRVGAAEEVHGAPATGATGR
jgi:hypothetical protein